ncbi:hypothetical protein [Halobaculum litoreum]|uniref:Zinc-ribbon domain-containing protein n=1 Tax=Halobaculum litoreum TaxID=3031998 RepID=A0ABD5XWL9_9EURY|nr:hypothetical protein [Halobaculum sp. DT92]
MRQDLVLASLLAGLAVAVLPAVLTFYLAAGPTMWLATGVVVAAFGVGVAYTADDRDADDAPAAAQKTNCPDCGSRVPVADAACDYCGAALDARDDDGA